MSQRIFIHANSVHQGGGRSLLLSLLDAVGEGRDWFANLDARLSLSHPTLTTNRIRWIAHSLFDRLRSEWALSRQVKVYDLLLCFANLPPLFRSHGRVVVFVQNRYLIEPVDLTGFSPGARWRIRMERIWMTACARNADWFVVQTRTMQRLLQSRLSAAIPILVLPFVSEQGGCSRRAVAAIDQSAPRNFDFLYVASGEPHKNHRNLIEAWCLLADDGQFPSLCLTVDAQAFPDLCHWIEVRIAQRNLNIRNLGSIPPGQVRSLYEQSRALIFPSQFESFGLPLIEARQAGLPVLAPEVDYVRDVLDPEEVFDAHSPKSIARAVQRFQGIQEEPLQLLDAAGFVDAVLVAANSGGG